MRNYDYLPDNREELVSEIARLDREVTDKQAEVWALRGEIEQYKEEIRSKDFSLAEMAKLVLQAEKLLSVRLGREGELDDLRKEVKQKNEIIKGLADRVVAQSELLSLRAEGR